MRKAVLFLSAAISLLGTSCTKDDQPQQGYTPILLNKKAASMVTANNDFGFQLLKKLNEEASSNDNIFISPLSVSQALGMAWNGASGETATEIASVLGYSVVLTDGINESLRSISHALLNADSQVQMSIANSIWYTQLYQINPTFVDSCKSSYDADVEELDFSDTEAAKKEINDWVNDQTRGKIPSIIDQINSDDALFLINAIYFKGVWQYKFNKENTAERPFTCANGELKEVQSMVQHTDLGYLSTSTFSAVELPYGNGHFSMVVMLPNENTSVDKLVESFESESWTSSMGGFNKTDIQLYLPKFKVECDFSLNNALKSLGMPKAFTDMAEFSKMLTPVNLKISKVKHKTFVEVSEEGTEAAAVTSIGFISTSVGGGEPQPLIFNVNRPFVFAIREKDTGSILFIGKIVGL